jgi:hypothetical protein
MKVLKNGAWVDGTPKGVLVSGAWKTPSKVSVLKDGVWVKAWPADVAAPPYLYDVQVTRTPDYSADFKALDGWPIGDPNEAYMFRCSTVGGLDGYVGRNFSRRFGLTGYSGFDCTLEDISNVQGKERKTISFRVTVGP